MSEEFSRMLHAAFKVAGAGGRSLLLSELRAADFDPRMLEPYGFAIAPGAEGMDSAVDSAQLTRSLIALIVAQEPEKAVHVFGEAMQLVVRVCSVREKSEALKNDARDTEASSQREVAVLEASSRLEAEMASSGTELASVRLELASSRAELASSRAELASSRAELASSRARASEALELVEFHETDAAWAKSEAARLAALSSIKIANFEQQFPLLLESVDFYKTTARRADDKAKEATCATERADKRTEDALASKQKTEHLLALVLREKDNETALKEDALDALERLAEKETGFQTSHDDNVSCFSV